MLVRIEVPVGTKGSLNVLMPEAFRDKEYWGPHLYEQRGVRMPLRYNYDKPEKPRISRVFGYLARFFILFQTEKSSREVIIS